MTLNFIEKVITIGGTGNEVPTLQFYKKGFVIGGGNVEPTWRDVILHGNTALTLINSKADGLNYLKLFGGCEQRNLPVGYTQVEYIESDGNQYIDTGVRLLFGDEFYFDYMKLYSVNAEDKGYGAGSDLNYTITGGGRNSVFSGYVAMYVCNLDTAYSPSLLFTESLTQRYVEHWKITTERLDSTLTNVNTKASYTLTVNSSNLNSSYDSGNNLFLFKDNSVQFAYPSAQRVYGVWLKRNNNDLALDLVPARRNSDNVLGMYDTVSGQFLTNQGTGDFVAGADVTTPSPDTPMDIVCNNGVLGIDSQGNITVTGTTETVEVFGKNLFDKNDITTGKILNDSGSETSATNGYYSDHIKVQPSTEYTISQTNGLGIYLRILEYDSTNTMVKLNKGTTEGTQTKTFTTDANTVYVIVSGSSNGGALNTVQLELGSTATTYEPYFNGGQATAEMLLAISTFGKDTQEVISGTVTNNIGIKILDGTENWESHNTWYWASILPSLSGDVSARLLCTHFVNQSPVNDLSIHRDTADSTYLQIAYNAMANATALKSWLATQYANGTPVIVLYCKTATTETVTAQPLTIQAGTNIVDITQASMDNLKLEVSYKAGVAVTITEIQNAQLDNSVEVTINE